MFQTKYSPLISYGICYEHREAVNTRIAKETEGLHPQLALWLLVGWLLVQAPSVSEPSSGRVGCSSRQVGPTRTV